MKKKNIFKATNALKILDFISGYPEKELLASEIMKETKTSRAGTYLALNELTGSDLIIKKSKGKFILFSFNKENILAKQFKILSNIEKAEKIIREVKNLSKKIILFGSYARGENNEESDIDIFIISQDPETLSKYLAKVRIKRKMQLIVKTPSDFMVFRERDKTLFNEIERGIVIYEG